MSEIDEEYRHECFIEVDKIVYDYIRIFMNTTGNCSLSLAKECTEYHLRRSISHFKPNSIECRKIWIMIEELKGV